MNPVTLFGIAYVAVPALLVFHTMPKKAVEPPVEPVIVEVAPSVQLGPEKPVEVIVEAPEPIQKTTDELLHEYFGDQYRIAHAVMMAESHGNKDAVHKNKNGSVDRGLMQVNSIHTKKVGGDLDSLFDPETNIRIAKQIYDGSGWGAWSTYKNGAYKKYLR